MKYFVCFAAAIAGCILTEASNTPPHFFTWVILMLISWDLEQKER